MSQPATPFGATQGFSQPVDVGVSWSNIRYKVGDREILKGLTGNALPRRALAIMGSSGAGKTTFLNALSDRLESDGKHAILSGERFLESVEYSRRFRTMIGYVTQEDVLDATSTPDEILSFSLRVRRGVSPEETTAQVDAMIDELGLTKARDTVVGIPGIITGLSGGERKRCNIGSELITNPKLLYLDEPTSGLDSVTSVNVCELLRKLAARGRTVVYTIHQPTAEVVACFDDLMLMCKGHVVYHGPMEESIDYFTSIGYPCPESHTPTDYFMSLLQDEEIGDVLIEKWQAFLSDPTNENHVYTTPRVASNDEFTKQYLDSYAEAATGTYAIEFTELMKRSLHSVARNKLFITTSIVQNVGFALIAGLIFVNLKDTVTGISDRMGLLFMVSANMAFSGAMGVLNVFPPKKAVFIREQQSGAYSPLLFFLTMSMAEIPVQVLGLLLQSVLIYFITGLQLNTAGGFFMYFAITVMLQQVSIGVGYAVGTAIDSFVVASGFVPLIIIPLMLCSGLLASTDRLRPYWYWLEKPSFIRAAFLLYADNEFGNLPEITCDPAKFGADFCLRQPKTGDQVLTSFQFNDDHGAVWLQWVILAIMFFIPRILTVLFLYRTARRKS